MEKSKIIRYCERCRKIKDNSIFKKYGNLCKECKENQYDEQISRFYRKLKKGCGLLYLGCQTILICQFLLKEICNHNNTIYYYNHLYLS